MKWSVEYSKRAHAFIEEHHIEAKVTDSIRDFILKITGSSINIDVKKLKGEWAGYYRIRKGKIRIILKPDSETGTVFVDIVDFRGSVYR
jgi:mRNA interferase RelE/StbE